HQRVYFSLFAFILTGTMELSAEALEAMSRLMTEQIHEANQSLAATFSQQLQEKVEALQLQMEQKMSTFVQAVHSSDSDGSHTPSLSEARRILKGKDIAGTSNQPAPRRQPIRMGGRVNIFNRNRSPLPPIREETRRQQARTTRQR